MPTLSNILDRAALLDAEQRDWLHLLVGDWQAIADLTFSDVLLIVKTTKGFAVAAQTRPATASTLYEYDVVGNEIRGDFEGDIDATFTIGERLTTGDDDMLVKLIPVRFGDDIIGVVAVITARLVDRVPSLGYKNYEDISTILLDMITRGEFPLTDTPTGFRHGTPRATDGVVHMDDDGVVLYSSPNATSHFRRFGIEAPLSGKVLTELVTEEIEWHATVDETLPLVLMGRAAWVTEVESHGVTISMRAIPLRDRRTRLGAVIFCRDVSELRRQEKELITKDATIREINHRVKNNLQTVSALLRLQARRATNEETRQSLGNAQRRIAAIALVHDQLSQSAEEIVEFDEVFKPLMRLMRDVAVTGQPVSTAFNGSFGSVRASQASALAVVMNEIISNAIEHGVVNGGTVTVTAEREEESLLITVSDDGVGITDAGPGSGLGTQIVQTMVRGELKGTIEWDRGTKGGTVVRLALRINV